MIGAGNTAGAMPNAAMAGHYSRTNSNVTYRATLFYRIKSMASYPTTSSSSKRWEGAIIIAVRSQRTRWFQELAGSGLDFFDLD